jgi:hypothetical protein
MNLGSAFFTDHESIWLAPAQPAPDREPYMAQFCKLMLTVIWNPEGFRVLTALPRGVKFNAGYHTTEILERIEIAGKGKNLAPFENRLSTQTMRCLIRQIINELH